MRDSNVANAAKESTQREFSHGLLDFCTNARGLSLRRMAALCAKGTAGADVKRQAAIEDRNCFGSQ